MAADYAGAIAAIKQRFVDNWLTGGQPITPYGFVNEKSPVKLDQSTGDPVVWVLFEIVSNGSVILGKGTPGNHVAVYDGLIKGHVFGPTLDGMGETDSGALQRALAIGEIFRNALFYNGVTAGCYVRSGFDLNGPPRIDEGDVTSNDGEWFAVTATIPFEYWHRA